MIDVANEALERYLSWIRDRTHLKQVGGWVEVTTPYMDRHNDCIQIYIRQDGSCRWTLTDDGATIADLAISGVKLDTPKRQEILTETLNGFGIELLSERQRDVLQASATEATFPQKKHHLIQAILAVNDMFQLSEPVIQNVFREDVARWLDQKEIRYTQNVLLMGKTGLDSRVEFVIPKSPHRPERLINLINNPTVQKAEVTAFQWIDVKESRPNSVSYALINDESRSVSPDVTDILSTYDIQPVMWSSREHYSDDLAA